MSYIWEGVVGNSGPAVGNKVLKSLGKLENVAVVGGIGFVTLGYNEGQTSMKMFNVESPHSWTDVGHTDLTAGFATVAYDGEVAYFGNPGSCTLNPDNATCGGAWGVPPHTEVIGLDLFSNAPLVCEHNFTAAGQMVCRDLRHNPCPTTWSRQTGGEFSFDGCNAEGQLWSSAVDTNKGNASYLDPGSGKVHMAESVSAVAVESRKDYTHTTKLFVAHRWLNETRVLDKKNGTVVGLIPMLGPSALSFGLLGSDDSHALFSIEDASNTSGVGAGARVIRVYTAYKDAAYRPTTLVLPGVIDPIAIAATKQHYGGFIGGGLLVADAADSTIKAFGFETGDGAGNGKAAGLIGTLIKTIGQPGGYADGNPAVESDKFFWGDSVTTAGGSTGIAADDAGCVWVTDNANRRLLRLNYSTGVLVGEPVSYAPASYCSTVSTVNPSRVFSNFVEYAVDYHHVPTKNPLYPASEGWLLVRNWLAGVTNASMVDWTGSFSGLNSIAEVGGRTFAICNMRRDNDYNHGTGGKVIVELDETKGMSVVLLLNNTDGRCGRRWCKPGVENAALNPDGSITYMNTTGSTNWTHSIQQFWRAEFNPSTTTWQFPGTLLGTIAGRSDSLRYTSTGNGANSYPQTPDGNLIIFDSTYDLNMSWNPHPNQGFHLGKLKTGKDASKNDTAVDSADWVWQVRHTPTTTAYIYP